MGGALAGVLAFRGVVAWVLRRHQEWAGMMGVRTAELAHKQMKLRPPSCLLNKRPSLPCPPPPTCS